jgi:hypothetical protein
MYTEGTQQRQRKIIVHENSLFYILFTVYCILETLDHGRKHCEEYRECQTHKKNINSVF